MTESFENLLNQILSANPKIGRDELLAMIERKKQESHGLLSDEGAIRLLAQQLSTLSIPTPSLNDQRVTSVHAGLNDATITAQILSVSDLREFQRSDGTMGKVLRMKVGDGSAQITCVLWDSLAETASREALAPGTQVRLLHGYTKFGMGGEVEFHLGSRASLQILGRGNASYRFGPDTPSTLSGKLGASDELKVHVLKLQKSQSENGPTWALCSGEGALMVVKFWDEHAQNILSLGEGALITVSNPWVTEKNGLIYFNVGTKSTVKKESTDFVFETMVAPISSLKPAPVLWTIIGNVVERSDVRDIQTREGRRTRVSNINLEDNTGRIRVSLWDVHADKTESLRIGDSVRMIGVKVRENMNGEREASTVFLTQVEKA